MAQTVVVDSSFFIRSLLRYSDPFALLDQRIDDADFAITGVVWLEVIRGRREPSVRQRYERRFSTLRFLNPTPTTWRCAAALAWELDRRGEVLPATDIAIAACALDHGAAVLTFDRHFNKVPGLTVLNDLP